MEIKRWYIHDTCLSTGTALSCIQTAPCTKWEGISVRGSGCTVGTALTFACLSAHWANKGSKVLYNDLCNRQTDTSSASAVIRAEKCLLHTCLCCHRRVDTLSCENLVQSVQLCCVKNLVVPEIIDSMFWYEPELKQKITFMICLLLSLFNVTANGIL